jgi:hypothetical protein
VGVPWLESGLWDYSTRSGVIGPDVYWLIEVNAREDSYYAAAHLFYRSKSEGNLWLAAYMCTFGNAGAGNTHAHAHIATTSTYAAFKI